MEEEKKTLEDNVVLIGNKPLKVYSYSIKTIFEKGINEITISARGKHILKAINLSEFLKRSKEVDVKELTVMTEDFKDQDGKDKKVSAIRIVVSKI